MDVSIIIPVYNCEQHIHCALDSALQQKFKGKLEVIVVNDGSVDNSGSICKEYLAKFYDQLTYLEYEENKGVSAARNTAMDLMKGEYFTFLDADDILPANAIQKMYDLAEEKQSDIVLGSIERMHENFYLQEKASKKHTIILDSDQGLIELMNHKSIRGHVWGKLFKNKKNQKIQFSSDLRYAEDLLFCVDIFTSSDSVCISSIPCYIYCQHEQSTVHKKFEGFLYVDWTKSVELVGEKCENLKFQKPYYRLKIKTIHQLVRELRFAKKNESEQVIAHVKEKISIWQISLMGLIKNRSLSLANLLKIGQINYILWILSKKALKNKGFGL
ncbi:MAG: glycosyltransferase family 2 protein [Pseudomonadota bacterium]|nr:glycosyltransferase family 2 protein [Pseudomonadota bacterium]